MSSAKFGVSSAVMNAAGSLKPIAASAAVVMSAAPTQQPLVDRLSSRVKIYSDPTLAFPRHQRCTQPKHLLGFVMDRQLQKMPSSASTCAATFSESHVQVPDMETGNVVSPSHITSAQQQQPTAAVQWESATNAQKKACEKMAAANQKRLKSLKKQLAILKWRSHATPFQVFTVYKLQQEWSLQQSHAAGKPHKNNKKKQLTLKSVKKMMAHYKRIFSTVITTEELLEEHETHRCEVQLKLENAQKELQQKQLEQQQKRSHNNNSTSNKSIVAAIRSNAKLEQEISSLKYALKNLNFSFKIVSDSAITSAQREALVDVTHAIRGEGYADFLKAMKNLDNKYFNLQLEQQQLQQQQN